MSSSLPSSSGRNATDKDDERPAKTRRAGLNMSALGTIISSRKRTNARMDSTQFEKADREFKRVGGVGDVYEAYAEAAVREAGALESAVKHAGKPLGGVVDKAVAQCSSRAAAADRKLLNESKSRLATLEAETAAKSESPPRTRAGSLPAWMLADVRSAASKRKY